MLRKIMLSILLAGALLGTCENKALSQTILKVGEVKANSGEKRSGFIIMKPVKQKLYSGLNQNMSIRLTILTRLLPGIRMAES